MVYSSASAITSFMHSLLCGKSWFPPGGGWPGLE
nr:MAG TPA: hypothetical protein [Caudoviricetes sp.]